MLTRKYGLVLAVAGSLGAFGAMAGWSPWVGGTTSTLGIDDPAYALGFKMKKIDGVEQDLSEYKGKVVLIVNVASKCGCTPQYQGLESLHKAKKDLGLVILGFPANNFGGQEPGSNSEIAEFCTGKFGVTFPMFEKISVKGEDAHPLYKKLASQPAPIGGEPKWNFTKFILDKEGKVVARYDAVGKVARTGEVEPEVLKKIDELLGGEKKDGAGGGGTTVGG